MALGKLDPAIGEAIVAAAQEVIDGQLDDHFPLAVWQTGSGTQSNMNANEVISNRAIEMLGGVMGSKTPVHPNDHVNVSQSSNDTYPTAMHIAAAEQVVKRPPLPALTHLHHALVAKQEAFKDIVKLGRTHTQDAMPLTLGQEFSGYATQVANSITRIEQTLPGICELAQGGTAVGTGFTAPVGFAEKVAERMPPSPGSPSLPRPTSSRPWPPTTPWSSATARSTRRRRRCSRSPMTSVSWRRARARPWRAQPAGERTRVLDHAGKVNPTQCEALTMVCTQVFGNQTTMTMAGASGHFELNVFNPVMAYNFLQSTRLIADSAISFTDHCVVGIEPRLDNIEAAVERSLMLVTALSPKLGYDTAAKIAKTALKNGTTLRQEAVGGGYVTETEFNALMRPQTMLGPG